MYERSVVEAVLRMIRQGPPLLQVLVGARHVGKTTAAEQVIETLGNPHIFAAADTPLPPGPEWIETQWARARTLGKETARSVVLVLDEIQKVRVPRPSPTRRARGWIANVPSHRTYS